jgi:predicted NBD/HSP70 family sugar kinase
LISGNGIRRIYGKPGEKLNDEEWSEVAYNLGQGLRNLSAILAPEVISLGGGVAVGGGEKLIHQAHQVMEANLNLVPMPELRISTLGYDTALLGAVAVAIHGIDG